MGAIQIAIYGAGGFGREVAWLAQSAMINGNDIEVVCFIDDDKTIFGTKLNDIEVLSLSQAKEKYPAARVVSGIGVPKIREMTMEKAHAAGFGFATLIHPNTEMSRWIVIGEGTVICAGNILTTNIVLGRHVQINLDCTIGHDVIMGDFATLAPGVHVSGCVHIGKRAYHRRRCMCNQIYKCRNMGRSPCPSSEKETLNMIGAMSFVNRDIPDNAVAYGVPVKIVEKDDMN